MENWKDIKGYEGHYQVSDLGRVKSLKRCFTDSIGRTQNINEKIIKTSENGRGYHQARLSDGLESRLFAVHRLVAIHFVQNKDYKPEVNHKDGDKSNNKASNLEWCTRSENMKHCYENGLRSSKGSLNGRAKINDSIVAEIFRLKRSDMIVADIADYMGLSRSLVYDVLNRRSWKHVEI